MLEKIGSWDLRCVEQVLEPFVGFFGGDPVVRVFVDHFHEE